MMLGGYGQDKTTSARLRDLCSCITVAQRANLKAIVEGRHSGFGGSDRASV